MIYNILTRYFGVIYLEHEELCRRYWDLRDRVRSDPEYARLTAQLDALEPMMREGCAGQLPEIYEGDFPTESKGCFGQAWSVGEMLRVFEAIEK